MSMLIPWSQLKYKCTAEEGEDRKGTIVLWCPFYVSRDAECMFVITFFLFIFLMLGLPWIANYQCCRSQPASYNPKLVQERMEAVQWSPTYCGSLQVFGWVVVFFLLFEVSISLWQKVQSLHKYLMYLYIIVFSEVGFVQLSSPLELP